MPGGGNLYLFGDADPVNLIDPSGRGGGDMTTDDSTKKYDPFAICPAGGVQNSTGSCQIDGPNGGAYTYNPADCGGSLNCEKIFAEVNSGPGSFEGFTGSLVGGMCCGVVSFGNYQLDNGEEGSYFTYGGAGGVFASASLQYVSGTFTSLFSFAGVTDDLGVGLSGPGAGLGYEHGSNDFGDSYAVTFGLSYGFNVSAFGAHTSTWVTMPVVPCSSPGSMIGCYIH